MEEEEKRKKKKKRGRKKKKCVCIVFFLSFFLFFNIFFSLVLIVHISKKFPFLGGDVFVIDCSGLVEFAITVLCPEL